ncbi:hypothetical protein HC248_01435 [Polaromonas vacuolata]|uniref:Uncharacterized protein n=1 Tax=Polaromonas vacuolata TaxID=37448 RepID=A0A6H2H8F1_9BURK|nr:hypothetical protein [Polaromonas vacuolata]QJC56149.1 hypothetical protein HC248_01435 [Polaromonas vacuolata]
MPIHLTPFVHDPLWGGNTWSVPNDDELASWIAWVAVGQAHHIATILHAAMPSGPLPTNADAKADAIALLTQAGADPSHRDGWMFQVMSWLAAHRNTPGALIALPHLIHAEKGLDGLEILLDASHAVVATVIFEDKATKNSRKTIREDVWPEFQKFETGLGVNRMTQQATGILAAAQHPAPSEAASKIVWKTSRRYRVSITAENSTLDSRKSLFKDYETTVPGVIERRRAEVFVVGDLRTWMAKLATNSIAQVNAMNH